LDLDKIEMGNKSGKDQKIKQDHKILTEVKAKVDLN
jgi:hypothetical protein